MKKEREKDKRWKKKKKTKKQKKKTRKRGKKNWKEKEKEGKTMILKENKRRYIHVYVTITHIPSLSKIGDSNEGPFSSSQTARIRESQKILPTFKRQRTQRQVMKSMEQTA